MQSVKGLFRKGLYSDECDHWTVVFRLPRFVVQTVVVGSDIPGVIGAVVRGVAPHPLVAPPEGGPF